MMRATLLLCIAALTAPARLPAQQDSVARPTSQVTRPSRATWDVKRAAVHWGKWLVAGAAVAFTAMGAHEHDNSNREFDRLLDICRADHADCAVGPSGTYSNAAAERLYQASIRYDRRARTRLLAGQASLLVAAGLFIADLRHDEGAPENKPFAPFEAAVDGRTGAALVGLRFGF